ncbi:hypothetical protein BJF82_16025 [Kytococcus sp. CUA-901]|nr:hypothetical protein BJF82_16025 [Kytococcus sp. CUA-901]
MTSVSDLVLDDVGQRAGGGSQRHVDDRVARGVHGDAVDEAEVDDVMPSSGSTTSRRASSTSATLGGVVVVMIPPG